MKKHVLLIDDDNKIHFFIKHAIELLKDIVDFDITFDYCDTLHVALQKLKTKKYDLVLLDYFINEDTSENFLIDIKNKYPNIQINIITSIRDYAILKKLLNFGASRIIYKPLSWNGIIQNIRENLTITNNKKEKYYE
jgi:response regulator of citrate/malate metabolism